MQSARRKPLTMFSSIMGGPQFVVSSVFFVWVFLGGAVDSKGLVFVSMLVLWGEALKSLEDGAFMVFLCIWEEHNPRVFEDLKSLAQLLKRDVWGSKILRSGSKRFFAQSFASLV